MSSNSDSEKSGKPSLFILAIGLVFLLLNLLWFAQAYRLKHFAASVQGTVSKTYTIRRKAGTVYKVDYAFDVAGQHYEGTGDLLAKTYWNLLPGQPIAIRYVLANPTVSETEDMSHYNTTLFLSGVLGLPTSLFILILAFRKHQPAPEKDSAYVSDELDQPTNIELPNEIQGIAFTMYPVSDMKRARRFYEEELGLKPAVDFRGEWIEYHLWDSCLALSSMAGQSVKPSAEAGGSIALEVRDVDDWVERLRKKGTRIKVEPFSTRVCRMAVIIDSEGNALTLHKRTRA